MMAERWGGRNSTIGGLAVLLLRDFLLWLVVPVAVAIWPFVGVRARRHGVTLAQYLGWVDVNLISFLQRTLFRPVIRHPTPWVPRSEMALVTHRVRASDPL